jgi:hypothetical protein
VIRRRAGEPEDDREPATSELLVMGGINAAGLPFDLSDDEAERRYQELLELEKRRRPCGFAAWPEETDGAVVDLHPRRTA